MRSDLGDMTGDVRVHIMFKKGCDILFYFGHFWPFPLVPDEKYEDVYFVNHCGGPVRTVLVIERWLWFPVGV